MKKFFSIFAFVAMLCVPFSFVSCGDDDPVVIIPQPEQKEIYNLVYNMQDPGKNTLSTVHDFIMAKMGNSVEAKMSAQATMWTLYVSSKEQGDAIFKGLSKYEEELNEMLKADGTGYFEFVISCSGNVVYKYTYNAGDFISFAGTYTYTEKDGAVWTLILTDESASKAGFKVGSFEIPYDVQGVKAGKYEGEYNLHGSVVAFGSNQNAENGPVAHVVAGFGLATEEGIPMGVTINGKTVLNRVDFQKK